jgi:predicted kinase
MEAVIFIGIQATGKSTFYQQHFFKTHVRINLDMLKTRHREDLLLRACIEARQSFVVDNTNVLKSERARYIALAKPFGFQVIGYYFKSRVAQAVMRNSQRTGQENIPVIGLVSKARRLEIPTYSEGFDRLYYISIDPVTSQFIKKEWKED